MECFLCQSKESKEVNLLVCSHYCCPQCYVKLKCSKLNCLVCNERLKRSNKKNRLLN